MKIVIPGGSGQIGAILGRYFLARGHQVVVLSRKPSAAPCRVLHWDAERLGDWCQEFEGAEAIINLAGRSVNCRYNSKNRREIFDSRVKSTRLVGQAISQCRNPPKVTTNTPDSSVGVNRISQILGNFRSR
jgi:NAD dependent epimerase/dehydratase family enzyme